MTSTHENTIDHKVFVVKISEEEVNELLKTEAFRVLRDRNTPLETISYFIETDGYRGYQVTVTCREDKPNEN